MNKGVRVKSTGLKCRTQVGTAKLNDINPEAYLCHVLSVIADYPVNRVDELLPWRVQL